MSNSLDQDWPNILLGLIWVKTVCKGYQQATKVVASGERVKKGFMWEAKSFQQVCVYGKKELALDSFK